MTGQDDSLQKLTHNNIYQDTYSNGSLTLTDAEGTFDITCDGKGTQVGVGKYVEKISGTAIGISGPAEGKFAKFEGTASGPGITPEATLKYSLKFIAPPKSISGSSDFLTSWTTSPNNTLAGPDTYSPRTTSSISVSGQDFYTEVQQNATTFLDTYPDGTLMLTGKAGTITVNFVGTGKFYSDSGTSTVKLLGTAVGSEGLVNGQVGTFEGSIVSQYDQTTSSASGKLTFKIKL